MSRSFQKIILQPLICSYCGIEAESCNQFKLKSGDQAVIELCRDCFINENAPFQFAESLESYDSPTIKKISYFVNGKPHKAVISNF